MNIMTILFFGIESVVINFYLYLFHRKLNPLSNIKKNKEWYEKKWINI